MDLTDKQKRFCEEYCLDWNATQAAIRAGYKPDSARQMGSENLSKPDIQEYIEECKNNLERLSEISALKVVNELKAIAFGNRTDLYDEDGVLLPFDELSEEDKSMISEVSVYMGVKSVKTYDKIKALQELAKIFSYHGATKVEVKHKGEPFKGFGFLPDAQTDE